MIAENLSYRYQENELEALEVMPSGLEIVRFRYATPGQQITIIGSPHPSHNPNLEIFTHIEEQWQFFKEGIRDDEECQVIVEGRLSKMRLNAVSQPGGVRNPEVDAENREAVIRAHGDTGLVTRLGMLSCAEVLSGELQNADRTIALRLEDKHTRQDIMRYYLYRQVPQWARMDPEIYPDPVSYLKEDVLERCRLALEDVWTDFSFSLESIVPTEAIESLREPSEAFVQYCLTETVGVMYELKDDEILSSVQRVAKDYNFIRTCHFARLTAGDWGRYIPLHKFVACGVSHARALANVLTPFLGMRALLQGHQPQRYFSRIIEQPPTPTSLHYQPYGDRYRD